MGENKNKKDLGWGGRLTSMRSRVCIPRTPVVDFENLHIKAAAGLCTCTPVLGWTHREISVPVGRERRPTG